MRDHSRVFDYVKEIGVNSPITVQWKGRCVDAKLLRRGRKNCRVEIEGEPEPVLVSFDDIVVRDTDA